LTKEPKIYTGEKTASSTNGAGKSTCRRLKTRPLFLNLYKINNKWIKDLNARPEILKLVQEKMGKTPENLGIGNNFLNSTPICPLQMGLHQLKSFCTSKETVTRINSQLTE
jgi:hypothetical protein